MPLSLKKLEELIRVSGYTPTSYYVMDGICFYIELLSVNTGEVFQMYIPSDYNFVVSPSSNVFEIEYIDLEEGLNKSDEYGNEKNKAREYDKYAINFSPEQNQMEDFLEKKYKYSINIKEMKHSDEDILKAIRRQVKRLQYCVQDLDYKLSIHYKNYICTIRRDNTIDCLRVKNFSGDRKLRLFVVPDLEVFYKNKEKMPQEISNVRQGVYRILDKNQSVHKHVSSKLLNNKDDILSVPDQAYSKKMHYLNLLGELEEILDLANGAEHSIKENMANEQDSKKIAEHDDKLNKIILLKNDIIQTIIHVKEKNDNISLSFDKVMFDNSVMLDSMINNFQQLKIFN